LLTISHQDRNEEQSFGTGRHDIFEATVKEELDGTTKEFAETDGWRHL
jgi:hypothetical protein